LIAVFLILSLKITGRQQKQKNNDDLLPHKSAFLSERFKINQFKGQKGKETVEEVSFPDLPDKTIE
jgi:hypothetical protein